MKILTKILLINWLYYSKQVIDTGTINFLTGKNSSGKSTIIDALQIVLLGELNERNFNKAANDKSQRTLDGYLRADSDDKNPKSRHGKDFSSYIACQFIDDQAGTEFVCGIVFDCRNDGTRREQFFIYNGKIPDNCFLTENQAAMDIQNLRIYLKSIPDAHEIFYDRHKQYRHDLLAKWNVHSEQVCRMLKMAVSYKPVNDIQKFITENICDIPEKPDIVLMQQNIRDYKRHEAIAQQEEEKLKALVEIGRLYNEMQICIDRLQIHRFLMLWAQKNDLTNQIEKFLIEKQDCEKRVDSEERLYNEIDIKITKSELRRDELIADRANSDVAQEQTRLHNQKESLLREQRNLMELLNSLILEIKKETQILFGICDEISKWSVSDVLKNLKNSTHTLLIACDFMQTITVESFSNALTPFEEAQSAVHSFSENLRETAFTLTNEILKWKEDHDNLVAILQKLKSNIKDYPTGLLTLKNKLEMELSTKFNKKIVIDILADVLEIAEGEESWRGAIEGYLNTQKFYLLIESEHYAYGITIFDKVKREFGKQSFGIIDIEKLREKEKLHKWDDSLAAIIQTNNPLARSYIDYLLGRVVRCNNLQQLRKHRTAITREGMLYHGYVARPIQKDLMDNTFIGRKAVALRINKIKSDIAKLEENINKWAPINHNLDKYKTREFIFTKRFITEVEQRQNDYIRGLEINNELDKIDEVLSGLDLFWLNNLDKEIEQLDTDLKLLRAQKEESHTNRIINENRINELDYEILPEKNAELSEKESRLKEDFSEHYIKTTGLPRYEKVLKQLKHHTAVSKNYSESVAGSYTKLETAKDNLHKARSEYVMSFQTRSFKIDSINNDEFENERKLIEESELPNFRERIKHARESALEQFQNDFLAKLKSSIDQVEEQIRNLNKALEGIPFGTDKYKFLVTRNPDEAIYYDMIKAPELMDEEGGLFAIAFQQKYGVLIEDLFSKIATSDDTHLNARKQSELQQNIERYTDYRTYLKFDLETTDLNGNKQLLSQTMNTKSGGETQTPFYIAVLASFAQLYRVNDILRFGNTVRLVVFDEAFNKMDSDRIIESIRLLRKFQLQAIICAPPDKIPDIVPEADKTFLTIKEKYTMKILPYSKEIMEV